MDNRNLDLGYKLFHTFVRIPFNLFQRWKVILLKEENWAVLLSRNQVQCPPVERQAWVFIDISFVFQTNEGGSQAESANESTSHMNGAACRQENGFYPEKCSVPSKRIITWRRKVFFFSLNLFSICFWDEECNSWSPRICLKPSATFSKLTKYLLALLGV